MKFLKLLREYTHRFLNQIKNGHFWLVIIAIIIVTCISIIKYRSDKVTYYNADATWHALLTIKAYDETPISKHLFLPIVSLGEDEDKYISWGDTIPDAEGNYYYTSFSPAGYFLPWLFFKTFNLPVTEKSLYIFNSFLFTISTVLWVKIITFIYRKEKYANFLGLIALLLSISTPEILHGMGIVYWHQSVIQVTLLIQVYAYLVEKQGNSKIAKYIFYGMTLINPYIEWTGYVANVGFALVELITYWKQNKKEAMEKVFLIGALTICSFVLFCMHYLLVVDAKDFFSALKMRFMARNITARVDISSLITGYITSFKYLWILFLLFMIWNFSKNEKIELKNRLIILLLCFPVTENFIMKEHAVSYSYDRMKLIFPLSLLICEIICNIIKNTKFKKMTLSLILGITIICGIFNIKGYMNNTAYTWPASYRIDNEKLATYINTNYENSLLAMEKEVVRGYINLLFERGIYENATYESVKNIAQANNKKYVVMIYCASRDGLWGIYKLGGATVYDLENNTIQKIIIRNGEIEVE